jgi:DHA1 family bicyclomycin/chloramphenicol resistance-like MFS transporter
MTDVPQTTGRGGRLSQGEFVAMIAVLFATIAFSIDAMLPALPDIAAELTPEAVNRAQLVLATFVLGMGVGTLVAGPVSDSVGRKRAIIGFVGLYILGAVGAAMATSIEMLLLARLVQGLGAAGPRIVSIALVRDLYEGRTMARIMSFVTMIFILIPAVAPTIGAINIAGFGWRGIFGGFVVFGIAAALWLGLRQEETLAPAKRRPFRAAPLWEAFTEVLSHRMVILYIVVLTLGFGQMFALLSSIQQIYSETFGLRDSFPLWFAATGLLSGGGSILNATLVMRLGMRRLAVMAYAVQTVISGLLVVAEVTGLLPPGIAFPVFFAWSVSVFFMAGLTFGNLNALALQPMGHIAGMAASVVGALSTVGSVIIAAPIGLAFDGTIVPLLAGTFVCSALALWLMRWSHDPEPGAAPR